MLILKNLLSLIQYEWKMVKEFELTVEIRHEYYDLKISKIKQ